MNLQKVLDFIRQCGVILFGGCVTQGMRALKPNNACRKPLPFLWNSVCS